LKTRSYLLAKPARAANFGHLGPQSSAELKINLRLAISSIETREEFVLMVVEELRALMGCPRE